MSNVLTIFFVRKSTNFDYEFTNTAKYPNGKTSKLVKRNMETYLKIVNHKKKRQEKCKESYFYSLNKKTNKKKMRLIYY